MGGGLRRDQPSLQFSGVYHAYERQELEVFLLTASERYSNGTWSIEVKYTEGRRAMFEQRACNKK